MEGGRMNSISEFEKVIADFYAEAARHGGLHAIIRAGEVVAIVKGCRSDLAGRWQAVAMACDSVFEMENHLRLSVLAIQAMIAANKAFFINQCDFIELDFNYQIPIADGVDLLA
jgi:hypothetical protein